MVVVIDHDSKVIARRTFRCRAWVLGSALGWAAGRAAAAGWAGVTVSCEPAGHRWRVLGQLAADRSVPLVCVQPLVRRGRGAAIRLLELERRPRRSARTHS
jgi:transposase